MYQNLHVLELIKAYDTLKYVLYTLYRPYTGQFTNTLDRGKVL